MKTTDRLATHVWHENRAQSVYDWLAAYQDWMQSELNEMTDDILELIAVLEEREESTDDSEQ